MLIDQQQRPSETLQEYIQRFSALLLKSSGLLQHQAKDIAHITHFIRNLHNQKLQHYVLGKNPTSVQNAIMLAQKKDAELRIIEGLYNHVSGHKINNIYPKHSNKPIDIEPCHTCNGSHLIKDCNGSTCGMCNLNLDIHAPSMCPRQHPFNKQLSSNPFHNTDNSNRSKINNHTEPNFQLSISTTKPDHMAESLEATRKMTKYFKRSYMHNKSNPNHNSNHHSNINHYGTSHPDR